MTDGATAVGHFLLTVVLFPGHSFLNENALTSSIPTEIGLLTELEIL